MIEKSTNTEHAKYNDTPVYIYYRRPRCPDCNSVRLKSYSSKDNGDGSRMKYSRCLDCGRRRLKIVAE
jgi:hypothetical protein